MSLKIVTPRIRGFISTNAHPVGCAANVAQQIEVARAGRRSTIAGDTAMVIGASTGYGLASRIVAAFGYRMRTLGVLFERAPRGERTATPGWYNTAAFHDAAASAGIGAESINGDAFSDEVKQQTIARLRDEMGRVDLLIYSLASPVRTHPETGESLRSVLKPVGAAYTTKTINLESGAITEATLEPATNEEIAATAGVMGGDDLRRWISALISAKALAPGARVIAYSYIGPQLTYPIYRSGTIGLAKDDLERTTRALDQRLAELPGGHAWVSVNKAVVTQASAAIPAVPLYISILYRVMAERGLHERPIEQMVRLFDTHLAEGRVPELDVEGRIRMDDREMSADIQNEVARRWEAITTENLPDLADWEGFQTDFHRLFGYRIEGVDYSEPVEIEVPLPA